MMFWNTRRYTAIATLAALVGMTASAWSATGGGSPARDLEAGPSGALPLPRAEMLAASTQTAAATPLLAPALAEFQRYRQIPPAQGYRAFAIDAGGGGWGQGADNSLPRIAIDRSMADCRKRAARDCVIYAVGDVVVDGLADRMVQVALVLYQLDRGVSNDDLAAVFAKDQGPRAVELRRSLLHTAAEVGNFGAVAAMLDQGLDVNARSSVGASALMYAASRGRAEVVALLLERGADVNARNPVGKTALGLALVAKRFAEVRNYRMDDHEAVIRALKAAGGKE